jgi:diguanylate cyclase (GGDEF)-like protein
MAALTLERREIRLALAIACLLAGLVPSAVIAHDQAMVWLALALALLLPLVALRPALPAWALGAAGCALWGLGYGLGVLIAKAEAFEGELLLGLPLFAGALAAALLARVQDFEEIAEPLPFIENEPDEAEEGHAGIDHQTGVFEQRLLRRDLESELARSRRFGRQFALLLVNIDDLRRRFDYRDSDKWMQAILTTAQALRGTRTNIDRVYHYGDGFALVLPESGEKDVIGLVRRLRGEAKLMEPAEDGAPSLPLPVYFGGTFYPRSATTVDDLLKRAEIVLKLARNSPNRLQLDGAEAPTLPPPETMRRAEPQEGATVGPGTNGGRPVAGESGPAQAARAAANGTETGAGGNGAVLAGAEDVQAAFADLLSDLEETLGYIRNLRAS